MSIKYYSHIFVIYFPQNLGMKISGDENKFKNLTFSKNVNALLLRV